MQNEVARQLCPTCEFYLKDLGWGKYKGREESFALCIWCESIYILTRGRPRYTGPVREVRDLDECSVRRAQWREKMVKKRLDNHERRQQPHSGVTQ